MLRESFGKRNLEPEKVSQSQVRWINTRSIHCRADRAYSTCVRDIVGGRSEAVQKTMRDSRKTALYELKKEAYEVGANAVVGVDLDYVELSSAGSMVMLVASGTAVVIED